MKIQGLPLNDGGLQRVENKKAEKIAAEKTPKSDKVELSRTVRDSDREINSRYAIPVEFLERAERVQSVTRNIANGSYDNPEVLEAIAEKIVQSAVVDDTVSSISMEKKGTPEIRDDMVNRANNMVTQKYYDQPEIMEQIAGNIIDVLGVSGMF
jgi:hypothetical protein